MYTLQEFRKTAFSKQACGRYPHRPVEYGRQLVHDLSITSYFSENLEFVLFLLVFLYFIKDFLQ
jgi:hypothetical protein